jgi:uncharacterized membrane protein
MTLPWHLYLMAALYVLAGLNHFRRPDFYVKIIPPLFPHPRRINIVIGCTEIILGVLLCIPAVSQYAALGLIALLVVVFPANLFMFNDKEAGMGFPKWMLLARLPLQIVLIIWAYRYTWFIH